MAKAISNLREHAHYHRDVSIWARGDKTAEGVLTGYWEWFRKDGSKMRSGYFEDGEQVGAWTTYDRKGKIVKVTLMKGKPAVKKAVKNKAATRKRASKKLAKKKSLSERSVKR